MRSVTTCVLWFLALIGSAFAFLLLSLVQIDRQLQQIGTRIQEDITFTNGQWDTSAYNADPLLPGTAPVYILANDGYVIERWKPIAGFLDASDFKHLSAFTTVQTIHTSTNQEWRVLSVPITYLGETLGVVTVSSYAPPTSNLAALDDELQKAAQLLLSTVQKDTSKIWIKDLDERRIPFHISYQVVNKQNTIIAKSNNSNSIDRLPNFIDPSYVANQRVAPNRSLVMEQTTRELYVIHRLSLVDTTGVQRGVVVIGRTISPLVFIGSLYLVIMALLGVGLILFQKLKKIIQNQVQKKRQYDSFTIHFDKQNASLLIGSHTVPLSYASNQYYLAEAICAKRQKRWEADELLEKFGEQHSVKARRTVYDAMLLLNKKVQPYLHDKLIVVDGKTYRFNPKFLDAS